MVDTTRRAFLSTVAAAAGGLMAAPTLSGPAGAAPTPSGLPSYRFPLEVQTPRVTGGGWGTGQSVANSPAGQHIAGVSMTLKPGGLRELHWHANAAEWGYVLASRCRVTLFDGDVGYVPQGFGHYIENTGADLCEIVIGFNSGEYEDISLANWIAGNPAQLVATNFGVSSEAIRRFRRKAIITKG